MNYYKRPKQSQKTWDLKSFKMKTLYIYFFALLLGCTVPSAESTKLSSQERLEAQTKNLINKSLGVWKGKDSANYALVDSADFSLFKVVFPDYILTDTVNVKHADGETFIYMNNAVGKECYKINVMNQLVYYDDAGKPFQTYESINK
jgi:hypothetical protein